MSSSLSSEYFEELSDLFFSKPGKEINLVDLEAILSEYVQKLGPASSLSYKPLLTALTGLFLTIAPAGIANIYHEVTSFISRPDTIHLDYISGVEVEKDGRKEIRLNIFQINDFDVEYPRNFDDVWIDRFAKDLEPHGITREQLCDGVDRAIVISFLQPARATVQVDGPNGPENVALPHPSEGDKKLFLSIRNVRIDIYFRRHETRSDCHCQTTVFV